MKILFICAGNVGRSVMAEGLLRSITPGNTIKSAGTVVRSKEGINKNGQILKDLPAAHVITVMKELGIDISEHRRKQLNAEMLRNMDIIVIMAERQTLPYYLKRKAGVIYWDIIDPKEKDLDFHRKVRDELAKKIKENINLFTE